MSDYTYSPMPSAPPAIQPAAAAGALSVTGLVKGFDLKKALILAAALAVAYWVYKRYYCTEAAVKEGFQEREKVETAAEQQGCGKSLLGNFLTCDKYAHDFVSRDKSPVERYQDQLQQQRQDAKPLVPDVKLPSVKDYVLPVSSSQGRWDKVMDLRGGLDVAYQGSLSTVSPGAIEAAMAAKAKAT